MKLHELHAVPGANKAPTRKGRGIGSGNGKTAGYGRKGQKAYRVRHRQDQRPGSPLRGR